MATNDVLCDGSMEKKLKKESFRYFYFHIRDGNLLKLIKADVDGMWKNCPKMISINKPYHTIQCAETTTLQNDSCINPAEMLALKAGLRKFIKTAETHQSILSFRYEARFGHLFAYPEAEMKSNLVTTTLLRRNNKYFRKEFVTTVLSCDLESFKQNHCESLQTMDPDKVTYKIRFVQYGVGVPLGEGKKFNGVCYIEENAGSFTLISVHDSDGHINETKIDIIRPGGVYDIRVSSAVQKYNEEKVPDCVHDVAEMISKSMSRSAFDPKEIRMQIVGDNFQVEYIRQMKKCEYRWKMNPRWILVEHSVQDVQYSQEICKILKRDWQFCPVPITFTQSDLQIELWSNVHSQPNSSKQWTTEDMLAADYFDEFVTTCFDIAVQLDNIASAASAQNV